MSNLKKLKNTFTLLILSIIAICLFAFNLPVFNGKTIEANAYQSGITISNDSFDTSTSSSYPFAPSSYTELRQNSNILSGVINISDSVWQNRAVSDYDLTIKNPKSYGNDNYILMINSQNTSNYMGYQSSSISLSASGHYKISVAVWSDSPSASVYLYDTTDSKIISRIENINTQSNWSLYTFYISTSNEDSLNVALQLYLGGSNSNLAKGIVFFDELSAYQITSSAIYSAVGNNYEGANYRYINLVDNVIKNYKFQNSSDRIFSVASNSDIDNNTTLYNYMDMTNSTITIGDKTIASVGTDNCYDNTTSLAVINKTLGYSSFDSTKFTLEPNRIYKYSIMVKVTDYVSGNLTLNLKSDDEAIETKTLTISSKTTNLSRNNYVEYSFYVKTDPLESKEIYFNLTIGTKEAKSLLNAYFTNFTISAVNNTTFTANKDNDTTAVIDLTTDYTTDNYFANAGFNLMEPQSTVEVSYPYAPTSWTHSGNETNTVFGVVHSDYFDSLNETYATIYNPGAIDEYTSIQNEKNNVLVMHNITQTYQSYTSSSITLDANSYYVFSIYVQTSALANGVKVEIVDDDDNVLAVISNIIATDWKNIKIYLHTSHATIDAKMKISLGSENLTTSGTAYFDNAIYNSPSAPTSFDGVVEDNYTKIFDLDDMFATTTNNINFNNSLYLKGESVKGSSNVGSGIVDLTKENNSNIVGEIPQIEGETKVLVITSNSDVYYTYTTNQAFKFEADAYYIIKIKVHTVNLSSQTDKPYGATLSITNFENSLQAIKSDDGWTTYTMYIHSTEELSGNLVFALGNNDGTTTGTVMFSNPVIEKLDSEAEDYETKLEEFNSQVEIFNNTSDKSTLNFTVPAPIEDEENEETADETNNGFEFNWLYFTSIVTVLAILIAIVGVVLRRVDIKLPKRKVSSDKSNKIANARQLYAYDANIERNKELKELKEKLTNLENKRLETENEYKSNISKIRELKMSRNVEKIKQAEELTKTNKSINRKINRLGKQISSIKNDINIVSSDEYIQEIEQEMYKKRKNDNSKNEKN